MRATPAPIALGSQVRARVAQPGAAFPPEPIEVDLASMTTAELVTRVLLPQHAALRTAGWVLRQAAQQLARTHAGRAPVMARVATAVDELVTTLHAQLDHEERALFPSLSASRTPTFVFGTIHDHHDQLASRLRCLQPLIADVRAAAGITHETMLLFAGVASLSRLFQRHRAIEQWTFLAPPAPSTPRSSPPAPRSGRASRET